LTINIASMRTDALGGSAEAAGDGDATTGDATAPSLTGADISAEFGNALSGIADLTINGQAVTLTAVGALDGSGGTPFDIDAVVTALQTDLDAVFNGTDHDGVTFTVSNDGDALVITSSETGSEASIEITANTASETLGLTEDATTDASVVGADAADGDGADAADGDGAAASGTIGSLKVTDSDIDSVETDADAAALANSGVLTQTGADAAITNINTAITQVSAERSKLGAYQNRLEHTISNLNNSAENLQAAEARIRDLDMAEEIMAFTKNNILQQAATAMLAQANMAPQSVLQLLG
jgi:flagellin